MRALHSWRLIVAFLLVAGFWALPVLDHHTFVVVADDDDDGDGGDGDDDDNGNGRDDIDDADNGNGRDDDDDDDGNSRGRDGDDDKDKKDNDKKDKKSKPVGRSAGHRVEVECTVTGDANESECRFTIVVGDDEAEVDHVLLPEAAVCAEVLDGDFEDVDDDDEYEFSGYRAEGDDDEPLLLILEGAVFPGGTTTYWFESDERVFPATGPGLVCGEAGESAPGTTLAITPPASDGAGMVVVQAYSCVDVPTDRTAYDWYGECAVGAAGQAYVLTPLDAGKDEVHAAETDEAGAAMFGVVSPGTWALDDETANWCHAESDNVTTTGDVVVETGQETTVWLFYCEGGS
ncbi:MAG: hypothetical protein H0T93_00350 [Chloroflexia bacterium]|nr:hypothetical protein [Chloroflexia bacterium]